MGVLGGMGPAATADFMAKFTALTPVAREADHLRLAVWSDPHIPDRTAALLGRGPSPVPEMLDGIRRLESIGATVVAIPCNTAHAFVPELRRETSIEILDMVDLTMRQIKLDYPSATNVGVISTAGTRKAGLYAAACAAHGLTALEVDEPEFAELATAAIDMVKKGQTLDLAARYVARIAQHLRDRGADAVVAGCSEIPLVSQFAELVVPIVDATECLALGAINHALIPDHASMTTRRKREGHDEGTVDEGNQRSA